MAAIQELMLKPGYNMYYKQTFSAAYNCMMLFSNKKDLLSFFKMLEIYVNWLRRVPQSLIIKWMWFITVSMTEQTKLLVFCYHWLSNSKMLVCWTALPLCKQLFDYNNI